MTSVRQVFPATSKGARAARCFATEATDPVGGLSDDVALVVSELAANAVLHAATPFTVVVHQSGSTVTIEVEDSNPLLPRVKDHGMSAPTGRGLRIVDQLTEDWGVNPTVGGKVVWARLEPAQQTAVSQAAVARRP